MKIPTRVMDSIFGPPECTDCGGSLRELDPVTPIQDLRRGRFHWQRCRQCWGAMVRRWETSER